jgi:hypothetical protein
MEKSQRTGNVILLPTDHIYRELSNSIRSISDELKDDIVENISETLSDLELNLSLIEQHEDFRDFPLAFRIIDGIHEVTKRSSCVDQLKNCPSIVGIIERLADLSPNDHRFNPDDPHISLFGHIEKAQTIMKILKSSEN